MATLDASVLALFAQTGHVAAHIGNTPSGDPIHAAPIAFKARVDPSQAVVTSTDGEDDVSDFSIITTQKIGPKDKVWVMGANPADEGEGRMPKRVEPIIDELGVTLLYEVLL
jgi:hypothetical protein